MGAVLNPEVKSLDKGHIVIGHGPRFWEDRSPPLALELWVVSVTTSRSNRAPFSNDVVTIYQWANCIQH